MKGRKSACNRALGALARCLTVRGLRLAQARGRFAVVRFGLFPRTQGRFELWILTALELLFGDRLLFVGHGVVVAGVDLEKLDSDDMWVKNGVLYVRLPDPEIFIATLDNEKSYVYDRDTGLLTHGDVNLETTARRAAEEEIEKAALEDGILVQARRNAENYMYRLFLDLGFPEVIFVEPEPPVE